MALGFDPNTSTAEIRISCIITHIPDFLIGKTLGKGGGDEEVPPGPLQDFDLTNVAIGNLEDLQWMEDYGADYKHYRAHLKTPANLMSQYKDKYSFSVRASEGVSNVEREIKISMPPDTDVHGASPSDMSTYSGRTLLRLRLVKVTNILRDSRLQVVHR